MADAGYKLTVEGEAEFRRAIKDINIILKENQSELKLSAAEYNASDQSMEALAKRHEELQKAIEKQQGAVGQMTDEYQRLKEEYGENATGAVKMQTAVNDASASLANMQAELQKVEEAMEGNAKAAEEMEKIKKAVEESAKTMADADAQIAAFSAELRAIESAAEEGGESLSLFGKKSEETEKKIKSLTEQNELLEKTVEQHKKKLDLLNDEMSEAVRLYGDQSREVAEYRTQIANTQTEVQELTKKIDANNDEIDKVKTGATNLSDVFKGISDITGVQIPEGLTNMVGGIDNATVAAGGLVTLLGSAVKGLANVYKEVLGENTEINAMAESAGLAASDVQELSFIAEKYHVDLGSIMDTLKDLRNNMYEAANGNDELAVAFRNLGVEISDDTGLRNALDVYIELSDRWQVMTNETERLAEMQKIMGESVNQSAQVAAAGSAELTKLINEAWAYGYAYSEDVNEELKKQQELVDDLKLRWEGLKNVMAVGGYTGVIEATDSWWDIVGLGGNFQTLNNTIQTVIDTIKKFTDKQYADGTYNHPGGYALVGEKGPEIAKLPAGTQVYPNGVFPEMGTVNNYNITISAADVREFNDIVRIAQSKRVTERMK